MRVIKTPKQTALMITISAELIRSFLFVQVTFFISAMTSSINVFTLTIICNLNRPGRIRTYNLRFWRPSLYQLELLAYMFR